MKWFPCLLDLFSHRASAGVSSSQCTVGSLAWASPFFLGRRFPFSSQDISLV